MTDQQNFMTSTVHVSASPHIRAKHSTRSVMRDVVISLLPACAMGVYAFGYRAFVILVLTVCSCILTELAYQKLMKLPLTIMDLSAVVTGMLIAMNMPSTIPYWMPVLGGAFAILVVKQLFGGIGHNIMNPALAARCFLLISFAAAMTAFPDTVRLLFDGEVIMGETAQVISGATPLAAVKQGADINIFNMIFNTHNGCIGEAYPLALIAGGVYLLARRVIHIRIPLVYILSTVGFICLIQCIMGHPEILTVGYLVTQVLGGGLLMGAFFMATDYVTSPITPKGQIVFALLLGLLTALFRTVGKSAEGVSYAIIICNLLVPLIERATMPRPFGVVRKKKEERA